MQSSSHREKENFPVKSSKLRSTRTTSPEFSLGHRSPSWVPSPMPLANERESDPIASRRTMMTPSASKNKSEQPDSRHDKGHNGIPGLYTSISPNQQQQQQHRPTNPSTTDDYSIMAAAAARGVWTSGSKSSYRNRPTMDKEEIDLDLRSASQSSRLRQQGLESTAKRREVTSLGSYHHHHQDPHHGEPTPFSSSRGGPFSERDFEEIEPVSLLFDGSSVTKEEKKQSASSACSPFITQKAAASHEALTFTDEGLDDSVEDVDDGEIDDATFQRYSTEYQMNALQVQLDSLVSLTERQSLEIADVKEENSMLREQLKAFTARHEETLSRNDDLEQQRAEYEEVIQKLRAELTQYTAQNQELSATIESSSQALLVRNRLVDQLQGVFSVQTTFHQLEVEAMISKLASALDERSELAKITAPELHRSFLAEESLQRQNKLLASELDRVEMNSLNTARTQETAMEKLVNENLDLKKKLEAVAAKCDRMATVLEVTSERSRSRTPAAENNIQGV